MVPQSSPHAGRRATAARATHSARRTCSVLLSQRRSLRPEPILLFVRPPQLSARALGRLLTLRETLRALTKAQRRRQRQEDAGQRGAIERSVVGHDRTHRHENGRTKPKVTRRGLGVRRAFQQPIKQCLLGVVSDKQNRERDVSCALFFSFPPRGEDRIKTIFSGVHKLAGL